MGIVEESDAEEDEDTSGLQENYNSLLEKLVEYARVKKMKKAEKDYRSLLVRYKEAKCDSLNDRRENDWCVHQRLGKFY